MKPGFDRGDILLLVEEDNDGHEEWPSELDDDEEDGMEEEDLEQMDMDEDLLEIAQRTKVDECVEEAVAEVTRQCGGQLNEHTLSLARLAAHLCHRQGVLSEQVRSGVRYAFDQARKHPEHHKVVHLVGTMPQAPFLAPVPPPKP